MSAGDYIYSEWMNDTGCQHYETGDIAAASSPDPTPTESRGYNNNADGLHNNEGQKSHHSETGLQIFYNELLDKNQTLERKNELLTEKIEMLWSQSAEVFRKGRPTSLENVADPFPILPLVDYFKHLYTAYWCDIWEEGEDDYAKIAELSRLMEGVNKECTSRANHQIKAFLGLDKEDKPPTRNQYPDVYHLRRMENISQEKRNKFTKKLVTPFVEKGFNKGIFTSATEKCEFSENVFSFFENFADVCWQLAIAEDDIIVDFDAVDKPYDDVRTCFNKYSKFGPVSGNKLNTVKTLVWPCVRKTDGVILGRGEVIVVNSRETNC